MSGREGSNRTRLRQPTSNVDPVLTPLGRGSPTPSTISPTPASTTFVQHSGNFRSRRNNNNNNNINNNNLETDANSNTDIASYDVSTSASAMSFDVEQFRSEIKANGHDEKRLEQLILNAINYFITTSRRSPQQTTDYTVLTFLAWTVSLHGEIFRLSSILKAVCTLLKGSTLTKTMKLLPTVNNGNNSGSTATPYTLVCQILWLAFKVNILLIDLFELFVLKFQSLNVESISRILVIRKEGI